MISTDTPQYPFCSCGHHWEFHYQGCEHQDCPCTQFAESGPNEEDAIDAQRHAQAE
jgi:hypothetical protein